MSEALLAIKGLSIAFPVQGRWPRAVDELDLEVRPGQIVGLVGESGCGKSMTALGVMGLVPPPGRIEAGQVIFEGRAMVGAPEERLRAFRGAQAAMIFQEPMTSLNPVFTVGRQIAEGVRAHRPVSKAQAWELAVAALAQVGIADPARRAKSYPHQLSGGMRQRVMIAMALAMSPRLLLADEPTTALDVTIQAQILRLMDQLRQQTGAAVLLITHDLAVVAQTADQVAVMYMGRLVEQAPVAEFFTNPLHPYAHGLLACLPSLSASRGQRLPTIGGAAPALDRLPAGCVFSNRCPRRFGPCQEAEPELWPVAPDHWVRCYLHHDRARARRREAA